MNEGLVIQAAGQAYTVRCGQQELRCTARGSFRRQRIVPLAGDRVMIERDASGEGVITEIFPRRNSLIRPATANIDMLVIVASPADPATPISAIDTMLAIARYKDIEPLLCINKCDLPGWQALASPYAGIDCPVLTVSAQTNQGIDSLGKLTKDCLAVFCGNSGVGKSSLLNAVCPGSGSRTGDISQRIRRGAHTTRTTSLYQRPDGGYIVDTPGFSSVDAVEMGITDVKILAECFDEFLPLLFTCKYNGCTHTREDGCAIIRAVEAGSIARSRHESYCELYSSVAKYRAWDHS